MLAVGCALVQERWRRLGGDRVRAAGARTGSTAKRGMSSVVEATVCEMRMGSEQFTGNLAYQTRRIVQRRRPMRMDELRSSMQPYTAAAHH